MRLYQHTGSLEKDFLLDKEKDRKSDLVLRYDSPYKTGFYKNDTVRAEITIAGDEKPFVILIHGFGSKTEKLDNYLSFIDRLKAKGFNVAFFNLPFHLYRTPENEESGRMLINFDDQQTLEFFHQSVVDIRKMIDFLKIRWPKSTLNIIGISLGCMVSTLVLANEKRISKGVLIIGGGNWHEIHWKGFLKLVLKNNCLKDDVITKRKCFEIYQDFEGFVKELGDCDISEIEMDLSNNKVLKEKTTKSCFLCDPAAWGQFIDPKKVLMINSRFDHYFTKKSSRALWGSIGRPRIVWLNKLHSSVILKNEKIFRLITDFISPVQ